MHDLTNSNEPEPEEVPLPPPPPGDVLPPELEPAFSSPNKPNVEKPVNPEASIKSFDVSAVELSASHMFVPVLYLYSFSVPSFMLLLSTSDCW